METGIMPFLQLGIIGILIVMSTLILVCCYLSIHKKNKDEHTEEEE